MPDLLIEIGCEELPSSACREAIEQLPPLFAATLSAVGVEGDHPAEVWVAPRRIAVSARVPDGVAPSTRLHRGPAEQAAFSADGTPTKAAQGFARGKGVDVADLQIHEDGGRRFVYAVEQTPGRSIDELVPQIVERLIGGVKFSKTMRWGAGVGLRFSRPVRWIVAKADDRTVAVEVFGLRSGEVSQGHRFLGDAVVVDAAARYRELLEGSRVVADHHERRRRIVSDLDAAAAAAHGNWSDPGGRLDEVTFLVEWPSVITGSIDPVHLRLPHRVLVTAMQSHQRYFPLRNDAGQLLPRFLAVSNGDPRHAATITRGNEGVLEARLQDAAFSFDKDLEAGLEALEARLESIVFHQKLGTMAAKRDRLVEGVDRLARALGVDDETRAAAAQAAGLAKSDQGAVLVAEFSELQGYVAAQYAERAGVDGAVCAAVADQYLPEGPTSPLPESRVGCLLAAAEKLDNLVGAFAVDEAPTGSKDPYGLRRAAMGLVRIVLEQDWRVDHGPLVAAIHDALRDQGAQLSVDREATVAALDGFLADRLAYILAGRGVGAEAVAAARGAQVGGIAATAAWAQGLEHHRANEGFQAVWTAATRLSRLARKGSGVDVAPAAVDGDPGEGALRGALDVAAGPIDAARTAGDFAAALAAGEGVAGAVDRFFVDVLVNADDPAVRARRYGLVEAAAAALGGIADFDRITDGGGTR